MSACSRACQIYRGAPPPIGEPSISGERVQQSSCTRRSALRAPFRAADSATGRGLLPRTFLRAAVVLGSVQDRAPPSMVTAKRKGSRTVMGVLAALRVPDADARFPSDVRARR